MARAFPLACLAALYVAGLGLAEAGSAVAGVEGGTEQQMAEALVDHLDRLYRSTTSHALLRMTVQTPKWERTLRLEMWTEGMEKTLIRILEPARERGMATLRIGNQMWNYLPRTGRVLRIPPSMMMASWMGSDFTNDDLVRETSLREDYEFTLGGVDSTYWYLDLRPKPEAPVVWGKITIAVRRDDRLPAWERFYDEEGAAVREMRFSAPRDFGDRRIPARIELLPLTKRGHLTLLEYESAEFDLPLDPLLFSLENLAWED